MAADGRFPFVRGEQDIGPLAGVLHRRGLGRWTVDDVVAEARQRLTETGQPMLTTAEIRTPACYLDWLMAKAVPGEPPAQIAAAAAATLRAERTARAREWAARQRTTAAAPPAEWVEARQRVDELAARTRKQRLSEARGRDQVDDPGP